MVLDSIVLKKVADAPTGIRTGYFPNAIQTFYRCATCSDVFLITTSGGKVET
jgi:hypothetical protein